VIHVGQTASPARIPGDVPPLERSILHTAADLIDAGEEFVLITVVRTQGSTPRNAGARMIWRPTAADHPNQAHGTVGGGQFEHLVLDAARECLRTQTHRMEKFVLGADADQCCGGTMEVFLEYHGRPARVVIFGAGHVAHALAALLAPALLDVAIVDDRTDWASAERFPHATCLHAWDRGVATAREQAAATIALVMTCSHDTDFDLLRRVLAPADQGHDRPAFVGLIGSRSKRTCLFGRLVAAGVDEAAVQRVRCPIGVGDTGKDPHAVAISIAAQVLMEAKALVAAG
jgi:xanthine dehydrogenase accessory factor